MLLKWFLVGLEISVIVNGQLSVTWNGRVVQNSALVFWHELPLDDYRSAAIGDVNRRGALVCRSEDRSRVSWHFVTGERVHEAPRGDVRAFIQIRTGQGVLPSIARLSRGRRSDDAQEHASLTLNGVWRCRVPGTAEVNIAIYHYAQELQISAFYLFGRGKVRYIWMELAPPLAKRNTFTLYGHTSGGPPSSYSWTYNDLPISNGDRYQITIGVNSSGGVFAYQSSRYTSALTVMGDLPGVYRYTATNRISRILNASYTIQREVGPANLRVQQNGRRSVEISWSVSSPPRAFGYRVTIGTRSADVVTSPMIVELQPGTYPVELIAIGFPVNSMPSRIVATVRDTGLLPPLVTTSSVDASSVIVNWVQPVESVPVASYMIVLTRVTGRGQTLCPDVKDRKSILITQRNTFSTPFTGLHEFSSYQVTVTATFNSFNSVASNDPETALFTTDSAAPTGAPGGLTASTMSRSVIVFWDAIECLERNGVITNYFVVFEKLFGGPVRGEVKNQVFTASELSPHTEYAFRVAGVNRDGRGPFSNTITFTTDEDVPDAVSNLKIDNRMTSVLVTWDPPQVSNGVIIAYEVTYFVNGITRTAVNATSTRLMISLEPNTWVSNISVRAFTEAGPGFQSQVLAPASGGPNTFRPNTVIQTEPIIARQLPIITVVVVVTVMVIAIGATMAISVLVYLYRDIRNIRILERDVVGDTEADLIPKFPSDMHAKVGERVFFGVVATGEPHPTFSWYHEDIELRSDEWYDIQSDGSLCIPYATLWHSGVYRLLVNNSRGNAEWEVRLTVTQQNYDEESVDMQSILLASEDEYN